MDNKLIKRKAQVAIWVIIAIGIVVIILGLFFLLKENSRIKISGENNLNPNSYIEICARNAVKEAVDIMLPQGGFLEPGSFKVYNDNKIEYLCLNTGYYRPCVNQHPMFLNEMKKEIETYVSPRIDKCFNDLKNELEKKQNTVNLGPQGIEVSFAPSRIFLNIERKMAVNAEDGTQGYQNFKVDIISPLYDLGLVAIEIAGQEAKYCYFEYVGYMIIYPKFNIEKFAMSDSTKIYTIEDKKTGKKLNIAIRSCAIPPGI